jgi:hypothetical protein
MKKRATRLSIHQVLFYQFSPITTDPFEIVMPYSEEAIETVATPSYSSAKKENCQWRGRWKQWPLERQIST